jgi:hypothetical protein
MTFTKGFCGRRKVNLTDNLQYLCLSPSANLNFGSDVPPAGKRGRGTSKYEEMSDASSYAVPHVRTVLFSLYTGKLDEVHSDMIGWPNREQTPGHSQIETSLKYVLDTIYIHHIGFSFLITIP